MNEIIKFLSNHPSHKISGRGTGLMDGCILLQRRDGRNRYDGDSVWFVRPSWVTAPVGKLP